MADMPPKNQHQVRDGHADLEIRYPDGHVVYIEVKTHGDQIDVRDAESQLTLHIGDASPASVGAASLSGWYVRSYSPPWTRNADEAGIWADWRTVGEDLWRAFGQATRIRIEGDRGQNRLFDPADLEGSGSQ